MTALTRHYNLVPTFGQPWHCPTCWQVRNHDVLMMTENFTPAYAENEYPTQLRLSCRVCRNLQAYQFQPRK